LSTPEQPRNGKLNYVGRGHYYTGIKKRENPNIKEKGKRPDQ